VPQLLLQRIHRLAFGDQLRGVRVPQAVRMHPLIDARFSRSPLEHVANLVG